MQVRTIVRMTPSVHSILRITRWTAWLALPVVAVGVLRLFPALALDQAGPPGGWLAPAAASLLALTAGVATLVAVTRALRTSGTLADLCAAAGLGVLASGAMAVVLAGPAGNAALPAPVLPVALLAAGLALLARQTLPDVTLDARPWRLLAAAAVFVWIELPPAIGLLGHELVPSAVVLAGAGAALLAIAALAAVVAGIPGERWGWIASLSAGALAAALVRAGTADLLPAFVALAAGGGAAIAALLVEPQLPAELRLIRLLGPIGPLPAWPPPGEAEEPLRLARELRGTIAELLGARQTVELQREELARLRTVDEETGVASRTAILHRLHVEAAEARRYAHPCALVLIDIDGMAVLNRERGQEVGNAVLRELALRLRLRVREADAVGRTDGDAFLAILPHTDERGATVFADAVRKRLTARAVETPTGPVSVSVSIGITILRPAESVPDDEALGRVEEALASARAAGGNRIAFDRSHGLARLEERREEPDPAPGREPANEA